MSDLGLDRLMSVDEAIAIVDAVPVEERPSRRPAMARPAIALGADVTADRDYPPFDKSMVDGFAVRAADLVSIPTELPCVGEIAAGHAWTGGPIASGTCVAIMTGAPLPPGVDAVVPVEETTTLDDGQRIRFATAGKSGRSIAKHGSDALAGDVVLPSGDRVGAAQIAVLAQLGKLPPATEAASAIVDAPVRAHVLVTGDEIVPHHTFEPAVGAIRDSNGPMLVALLGSLGVAATRSHVGDDPTLVRATLDRLASDHPLLFVTGGMSMGRHDHIPASLRALGFDLPITKVRMKPGKPFVFAVRDARSIVFGLPGNPVSGFCCTLRLAARLIRRMQGLAAGGDVTQAMLATPLPANGPREFYQPATLDAGRVTPLDWKGSADVFTLARADAMIVRAADEPARGAGDLVRILAFPR